MQIIESFLSADFLKHCGCRMLMETAVAKKNVATNARMKPSRKSEDQLLSNIFSVFLLSGKYT
jgi:hypothetical protein